jgi:cyclic pyranopterin phosphate synthase
MRGLPHNAGMESVIADRRGRIKRKLRISLTDRCNFRCAYCMPETPEWAPRDLLLNREELLRLARLFVTQLGITQLRLTGGEPLLRTDLEDCITELGSLRAAGLERISLTTNGTLLARRAATLHQAGLDDLNVSLDALEPERFHLLSGGRGAIEPVLEGIEAARACGLPTKINAVIVRDHNDDQVLPLARWAQAQDIPLRFIEFMPLDGNGAWSSTRVVPESEILEKLRTEFSVEPIPRSSEPATYYSLNGHYRLGVISTISNPFCTSCDRLRLTATGELYACLFSSQGRDLRTPLRCGENDVVLENIIRGHVWNKEAGYAANGYVERPISMHALGG